MQVVNVKNDCVKYRLKLELLHFEYHNMQKPYKLSFSSKFAAEQFWYFSIEKKDPLHSVGTDIVRNVFKVGGWKNYSFDELTQNNIIICHSYKHAHATHFSKSC